MAYKHGVYVSEQATSLTAPISGTAGLQVVVGTAPVHLLDKPEEAVNVPVLVSTFAEAAQAVGYLEDFGKYTLCEAVSASLQVVGVAPLVLINVLDPNRHSVELAETTVQVNGGVATLAESGVLLNALTVQKEGTPLEQGTDYIAAFNDDGTVSIALISGGAGDGATTLTVSGKRLDPDKVTEADIVGGVDAATGKETGMELIRQIYPRFGMPPGILLAPRWSARATVAAALQAKTHDINGVFGAVCIVDVDSGANGAKKYADVKAQKEKQGLTDERAYPVWLYGKVGETVYSGSALAAAVTACADAENDDTPNASPSNRSVSIGAACLEDGTEVVLDLDHANAVNGFGVATFLNVNGFKLWGNNTAAYPGNTDPKDRWFCVKRFMLWRENGFIQTYFQRVDSPMNKRLIEAIVDSENVRGNSFVARDICARDEIVYSAEENTVDELMNGHLRFHHYVTPYPPAEVIESVFEFDPDALTAALN